MKSAVFSKHRQIAQEKRKLGIRRKVDKSGRKRKSVKSVKSGVEGKGKV